MQRHLTALNKLLAQEKALYGGLLEKAREKKECIVHNDLEKLGEILLYEDASLAKAKKLDQEKLELLSSIGKEAGVEAVADLTQLIALVQDPVQKRILETYRVEFGQVIAQLDDLNRLNQRLLETQLQYTAFCLDVLTREEAPGGFYGSTGQVKDPGVTSTRGLINRKV